MSRANRTPGRGGPGRGTDRARRQGPASTIPLERVVAGDPRFAALVKQRTSFAWLLSAIMAAVYLGFIVLVAFAHDLMATKVVGDTSLGILLGLFVIVLAFVLTGVYVSRANTRFDRLTRDIVGDRRP